MEIQRGSSSVENLLGYLYHEAVQLNFFCERICDTIVMWPKAYGHIQGIHRLGATSVCLYSPIEESNNTFTTSLWSIEILKDVLDHCSKVNPYTKKIYAIFNMKNDMERFVKSPHFAVIKPEVVVTHGPLLSTCFKQPVGTSASLCKVLTVSCSPGDGKNLWDELNNLACSQNNENSEMAKVRLAIKKPDWWQMTCEVWLNSSVLPKVIVMVESMNLCWTQTNVKQLVACLDPNDRIIQKMNQGLQQNYSLTGIHTALRDMSDFPNILTPAHLQSIDHGFDKNVKLVGIPMVPLSCPNSDIIFSALKEEQNIWDFSACTKDDRHLLPDDLVGVIISALLMK